MTHAVPASVVPGTRRANVRTRVGAALAAIAATAALSVACAASSAAQVETVAQTSCKAIAARLDALPGDAPVLLRSYDNGRGQGTPDEPPLRTAAFTYDNALAVIALLACGQRARAERIGEALRLAATNDERLRDAYRAGVVANAVPLTNGWRDKHNRWIDAAREDVAAYQDGTATGNAAWAALALLALHDASGDVHWRDAAIRLAGWVVAHASDARGHGGFDGGIEGRRTAPKKAPWKSTEHNIDLAALFGWLDRIAAPGGEWAVQAKRARDFVAAQWDATSGHFWIGTLDDGATPSRAQSGLDVQLWAQLLPDAPAEWQRALAYVEREHAVAGGFDFNADRDGLWTEGTAQAALVYRRLGREADAESLFATIARQAAPGGFHYATREPRITSAYFHYYRRPHLAATAWAALAALNRNPFVPRRISDAQ